jgi:hypothetical protein
VDGHVGDVGAVEAVGQCAPGPGQDVAGVDEAHEHAVAEHGRERVRRLDAERGVRAAGPARGQVLAAAAQANPRVCTKGTGYVEDIIARTDAACLIDIHLKRTSYAHALRSGRLSLEGPPQLTSAFTTWIRPSPYADIVPARRRPAQVLADPA